MPGKIHKKSPEEQTAKQQESAGELSGNDTAKKGHKTFNSDTRDKVLGMFAAGLDSFRDNLKGLTAKAGTGIKTASDSFGGNLKAFAAKAGLRETAGKLSGKLSGKHKVAAGGVVLVLACTLFILPAAFADRAYSLTVDGRSIAVVSEKADLDSLMEEIKAENETESGLDLFDSSNEVAWTVIEDYNGALDAPETMEAELKAALDWNLSAGAVFVNDEPVVMLRDLASAEAVLEKVKKHYLPEGDQVEVLSNKPEEKVEVKETGSVLAELTDEETAFNRIVTGKDYIETYKIQKGDTLWDIAHENSITVTELREANPSLQKSDIISIGQELRLVKSEPMIHMLTSTEVTQTETIRYKTQYISDPDSWRGQSSVQEYGKNGKREVTYSIVSRNGEESERTVLEETILSEPTTQVILQGTKAMLASSGGGGDGIVAWPTRGRISSYYGWRTLYGRSNYHTGIDITGRTGDPLFAAEDGTVESAGWAGAYGYCIVINHGDGMKTRYAHMSQFGVSKGDTVARGDFIGKMGSTGNSTGPHVHFEVIINGKTKNPMNYLGK